MIVPEHVTVPGQGIVAMVAKHFLLDKVVVVSVVVQVVVALLEAANKEDTTFALNR